MERSEETLSTRDLAQPNGPATDRDVAADPVAADAEGQHVYDQAREGPDQPKRGAATREQTGVGTSADEHDRIGEVAPTGDASAATAVGDDEGDIGPTAPRDEAGATTASGRGATSGSTALRDDSIPPPRAETAAAGASAPDAPITGTTDAQAGTGTGTGSAGDAGPLLSAEATSSFQRRWEEVQTRFVDEPRGAVEDADGLVANLMKQLAEGFAQERERLEAQWDRGEDISTEDLRIALQRYRSFFQRLLSA
jgi:hypothetical protein